MERTVMTMVVLQLGMVVDPMRQHLHKVLRGRVSSVALLNRFRMLGVQDVELIFSTSCQVTSGSDFFMMSARPKSLSELLTDSKLLL
jgi:hypothetical protein